MMVEITDERICNIEIALTLDGDISSFSKVVSLLKCFNVDWKTDGMELGCKFEAILALDKSNYTKINRMIKEYTRWYQITE